MPILSVVIVAWRSREEIGPCLQSLPTEVNGRAVEVFVVDNSRNEDGTAAFLEQQAPRVRCVVPPENLGFGRANNLGFRETSGECVLFLNPDTICNAAAIGNCVERLRQDPSIGLITPKLVMADGSMDLACRRSIPSLWDGFCRGSGLAARFPRSKLFSGYNLTYLDDSATYDVGAINGAFMMGRRCTLAEVASPRPFAVFDETFFMYGDDLDLCIRTSKLGFRIVYDGRFQMIHLKGTSVAKDYANMSKAIFDANRDVFLKHFNPSGSMFECAKYKVAFGLWKLLSQWRARKHGWRSVRPL